MLESKVLSGWNKVARLTVLVVVMALAPGLVPATAGAAAQMIYYTSPHGSGKACTQSAPCALGTAKSAAERRTSTMSGDLVVELAAGTYQLSSPLTFGPSASGENGHDVIYRAEPGKKVVLSGGRSITGWSLHDAAKNIWKAPVPAGLKTRQLWVDGRRATVASMSAKTAFGAMQKTANGFTYASSWPNTWHDTGDVDVVYGHRSSSRGWTYSLCPVSSVSGGTVTMNNACHTNASSTNGITVPTAVENNYALLGSPGQFYLDTSADTLYYIPQANQDMTSAKVTAGGLQTLVELAGTPDNPVHNMQFTGLSFEHATWLFGDEGLADLQANVLLTKTEDALAHTSALPANVACHSCDDVTFRRNTFQHLGGSGLGFDGGGQNNSVIGNVITDVSGNGLQIGDGSQYTPPARLESGYTVSNNYVHDVANEYQGGVGIVATWVKHTHVAHNEVWDTPYTGISLGWGWGVSKDQPMIDNHVDSNYVHNVMTSALEDGGAIYVNGSQGAAQPSVMTGNHVENHSQRYGALYLDNGASYWQVERNVVSGYAPAWLFAPTAEHNTVHDNYAGADAGAAVFKTPTSTNTVADNTVGVTTWNVEAQAIMANAGLEPQYTGIRNGEPQTNLAYGKPAVASSTFGPNYPASQANNDRIATPGNGPYSMPFASAGNGPAWWQVDLGAPHPLSKIQILFRQDGVDNPAERQNLQIRVSNHADISQGHTIACVVGPTPLPYESSYSCSAPPGAWRYVDVVKPSHLVLGQVRVFGGQAVKR